MKKLHLIALLGILPAGAAFADNVTYTIDPNQSSLVLTGTWGSIPFSVITDPAILLPHFDGITGFIDTYAGTITADRNFHDGTLQITSANIVAQNGGFGGMMPDGELPNYAMANQSLPNYYGVIYGFSFSLNSPVINTPTSFDVSQLIASITSGQISSAFITFGNLPVGTPEPSLSGVTPALGIITDFDSTDLTGNFSLRPAFGSALNSSDGEILAIPISTDIFTTSEDEPLDLHFSGFIVAKSTPEPNTLTLLAMAPFIFFRRRNPA